MRRLIIVRPEPGASASVREAAALGLDAVAMPLFAIEPLTWDVAEPGQFGGLLLTSANALRHGGEGLRKLRGLPVHAVGEATAAAARDAGFEVATSGHAGVERLLGSIDPDLRLLHLCGEHRTPVQSSQPITEVPVYRSAQLPAPLQFSQIEGQVVAVHSARAAARVGELADQQRLDRSSVAIAAISQSAALAAGSGWQICAVAERPDSAALLALAARLCDSPVRP